MDGMWDSGLIPMATHYEIKIDDERIGFFAINEEGALVQFFILPEFEGQGADTFRQVVAEHKVTTAIVATIDPQFLSLCLDCQGGLSVHTLLYGTNPAIQPEKEPLSGPTFTAATIDELDAIIAFQVMCLGGNKNLVGWLTGYSSNLIERKELFVLRHEDAWLGLGEMRKSDTQPGIADVGMMVSPEHRGQGLGTDILLRLRELCAASGLNAICSTTLENAPSQIAIKRAGFTGHHRILEINL